MTAMKVYALNGDGSRLRLDLGRARDLLVEAEDGREYRIRVHDNALEVRSPHNALAVLPHGSNIVRIFECVHELQPVAHIDGGGP